jgi:hypothetical protein
MIRPIHSNTLGSDPGELHEKSQVEQKLLVHTSIVSLSFSRTSQGIVDREVYRLQLSCSAICCRIIHQRFPDSEMKLRAFAAVPEVQTYSTFEFVGLFSEFGWLSGDEFSLDPSCVSSLEPTVVCAGTSFSLRRHSPGRTSS